MKTKEEQLTTAMSTLLALLILARAEKLNNASVERVIGDALLKIGPPQ